MKATYLADRGIVKVSGADARDFLNGLVTTDVARVTSDRARFGALLTPQGKIVVDFFIAEMLPEDGGGLLLDCPRALAQPLADKLKFYRLRAKVLVENLSDKIGVVAAWDGTPSAPAEVMFADPRNPKLGFRIAVAPELARKTAALMGATLVDVAAYEAHRVACGAPSGGSDFLYGDAFPHEANMDRLHGVDFDKGCYVGQEVVSRMQHRGTARTRTVRVAFDSAAPPPRSEMTADGKPVGTMGSSAGDIGLALLRIDRVADALENAIPLMAAGVMVRLVDPADVAIAPARALA